MWLSMCKRDGEGMKVGLLGSAEWGEVLGWRSVMGVVFFDDWNEGW